MLTGLFLHLRGIHERRAPNAHRHPEKRGILVVQSVAPIEEARPSETPKVCIELGRARAITLTLCQRKRVETPYSSGYFCKVPNLYLQESLDHFMRSDERVQLAVRLDAVRRDCRRGLARSVREGLLPSLPSIGGDAFIISYRASGLGRIPKHRLELILLQWVVPYLMVHLMVCVDALTRHYDWER